MPQQQGGSAAAAPVAGGGVSLSAELPALQHLRNVMLEEQSAVEKKYKEHSNEVKELKEYIGKLEYQRNFLKNTVREQDAIIAGLKGQAPPTTTLNEAGGALACS